MKLIIAEHGGMARDLEREVSQNIELKNLIGDFKIYYIHYNNEILNIYDKKTNKQFFLSHRFHEDAARNTSDEFFPFDPTKFDFRINSQDEFNSLSELINQADTIIGFFDVLRMSDSKFNSLIYSGLFDLKDKKVLSGNLNGLCPSDLLHFFSNLENNIEYSNKLKITTPVDNESINFEIYLNEFDWKDQTLNLEEKPTISNEVIQKYSKKYNVDLLQLPRSEIGGWIRYNENKSIMSYKDLKSQLISKSFDQELLKSKGVI